MPYNSTRVKRRLAAINNGFPLSKHNSVNHNIEDGFDPEFYRDFYRRDINIRAMSHRELRQHFLDHGAAEGRFPSADVYIKSLESINGNLPQGFDEALYFAAHPDIHDQFSFPRGGAAHFLSHGRAEGRTLRRNSESVYTAHYLNLRTNRIYDLPEVVVDINAPARINVLVPAFDFKTMSAGFFGVFQVARFIKQAGFRVRLVLFDNFYWDLSLFKQKIQGYPGMEDIADELEIEYIGERLAPLTISPRDNAVATVWYSAYMAEKINRLTGERPFLYLIQDYESNFFPGSSLFAFADRTYSFKYNALFSSESLQDFFLSRKIGAFSHATPPKHLYFNNACASKLPDESNDFQLKTRNGERNLVLYSRPMVDRNMFELGALALCRAYDLGIFDENWNFFGVGIGEAAIEIAPKVLLNQLPRKNLKDYQNLVSSFDIGLSLMASPHPSLLPFDLGGAGAIVVTNSFATKQQSYFDKLCTNVITKEATRDDIVEGLREAVERVSDWPSRHKAALEMKYPRSWDESFSLKHVEYIRSIFVSSINSN